MLTTAPSRSRRALGLWALLLALPLGGCGSGGDDGPAPGGDDGPGGDRILFHGARPENGDVVAVGLDGGGRTQITESRALEFQPRVAPTGDLVAFKRGGDLYVRRLDGSGERRVAEGVERERPHAWSPDGSTLVFVTTSGGGDIASVRADGSGFRRLTDHPAFDGGAFAGGPVFSPDGSKIAFISTRDERHGELYVMDADGSDERRLTFNDRYDFGPAFSRDGSLIAFVSAPEEPGAPWAQGEVHVVGVDGSALRAVSTRRAFADFRRFGSGPVFTPDGARLLFVVRGMVGDRPGTTDIYAVDLQGTNETQLTDDPANDGDPAVSRDGLIAFVSDRAGDQDIWLMNADGSGERALRQAGDDYDPSFTTDGRTIVHASDAAPETSGDLFLIRPDGTAERNLTRTSEESEEGGVLSPDGRLVAFPGERERRRGLYLVRADGADVRLLHEGAVSDPVFSPDGARIAFVVNWFQGDSGADADVWVVDVAGGQARPVTDSPEGPVWNIDPAWSPDGRQLVYASTPVVPIPDPSEGEDDLWQAADWNLFVTEVDGGEGPRQVTDGPAFTDSNPAFAAGGRIVFERNSDIWVVNPDGSGERRLTNDASDGDAVVSPDGRTVAMSCLTAPTRMDICTVDVDGGAKRVLTASRRGGGNPVFSPDGTRIAFGGDGGPILIMERDGSNVRAVPDVPGDAVVLDWR